MESLVGYGSSSGSGSDSASSSGADEPSPGGKRRRPSAASPDIAAAAAADDSDDDASVPARSFLPPAAALLDGSYAPPPAHQQRALEAAALHQGRARAFPHVTGSYPTHVYIEAPAPHGCQAALEEVLQLLRLQLPHLQPIVHSGGSGSGSSAAGGPGSAPSSAAAAAQLPSAAAAAAPAAASGQLAQPSYHVSLSRTVPLRAEQIEPLVDDLRRRLRRQEAFSIRLAGLEAFANDDRSRTFLSLAAVESSESHNGGGTGSCSGTACEDGSLPRQQYAPQLIALCHSVSGVFSSHGLPRFYADPRPHASVAWLLGDQREALEAALAAPEVAAAAAALAAQPWVLQPAAILCRAGQKERGVWSAGGGGGGGG